MRDDYRHLIPLDVWRLLDGWRAWMRGDVVTDGLPRASAFFAGAGDRIQSIEDLYETTEHHEALVVDRIMDDLFRFEARLALALRREVLHENWQYRGTPDEIVPVAAAEFRRRAIKADLILP